MPWFLRVLLVSGLTLSAFQPAASQVVARLRPQRLRPPLTLNLKR